jgi:hypothetical protein
LTFEGRTLTFEGRTLTFEGQTLTFQGRTLTFQGRTLTFQGQTLTFWGRHSTSRMQPSVSRIKHFTGMLAVVRKHGCPWNQSVPACKLLVLTPNESIPMSGHPSRAEGRNLAGDLAAQPLWRPPVNKTGNSRKTESYRAQSCSAAFMITG